MPSLRRPANRRFGLHGLWALLWVWASPVLLQAPTGGTFCWDEVNGAIEYHLYAATPSPPGGAWQCVATVSASSVCASGTCCAVFEDEPGALVFYIVTADDNAGGESDGGHGPKEPCP